MMNKLVRAFWHPEQKGHHVVSCIVHIDMAILSVYIALYSVCCLMKNMHAHFDYIYSKLY